MYVCVCVEGVSGKQGIVFKIDFAKAYDYVELSLLDFVLEKERFWRKMENLDKLLFILKLYSVFLVEDQEASLKDLGV